MTDPVKIIVGEGSITEVNVPEYNLIQTGGGGGGSGSDGATFFPEVSEEGVISWTNDGGYDNPEPVNIKGPAGNDGNDGEDGTTFTPAVDASGNLSWTNDGGKQNPQTVNIKGPAGNDGNDGEDGEDGVSPTVTFTTITGGHTMTVTDKDHPSGQSINIMDGSGGSGTSDYDDLTDKPSINGTTLSGNKTAEELGLGTYSKPSGGIPKTDLESAVKTSLGKADSALQSVPSTYRTSAAQDAIDSGMAKADEVGVVITGARPSIAVNAGQYVIVRNSTISGITDGLYTANAALSPSTDVTAANLMAVSNGGFNELSANIKSVTNAITGTVTPIAPINTNAGSYYLKRIGGIVYYMFRFTLVNTTPNSNFKLCSLPQGFYPSNRVICMACRLWNRQTSTMPETLACTINADGLVSANTTGVPDTSTEYILQGCYPI